ncbi:MAG: hypothetical protein CVU48_00510 [Candidatus Cloacimonetes bacterium HGW-Cloacimonetes-1]|nr:MAG: hypothetical protein CVU48_00510 [Candidatus Cloacimonetes bacterium HGW-Cloacimonetes-1]
MNPYLSTMEYSHYTMRGGASGLDKAYAQGWSFHPWEILTFVVPDFFGGITTTPIPNMPQGVGPYWGWMDFTQIYNYFGIIVLALGLMALFGKHRKFAGFIWISSIIFTVMSFGKFAPLLSDLLLKYLPYFNKFRVPSMILVMVQINAVILAALGLDTIIDRTEKGDTRFSNALFRVFWATGIIFVFFMILSRTFFKGLPLATEREIQIFTDAGYTSMLDQLKAYRLGMLAKSGIISFLLLTLAAGASYLFSAGKFKRNVFVVTILILTFVDLGIYTGHYLKNNKPASEHRDYFAMKDYDEYLKADKDNFRIFPSGVGPAGDWAYYHQTVDGYSAAKLKRYDDVLRGNLLPQFNRYKDIWEKYGVEVPTQILDMLSTKYIILADTLPGSSYLQQKKLVFASSYTPIRVYQNNTALPRAWFVDNVSTVSPADSILPKLNSLEFDPAVTAYVELPVSGISKPQVSSVKQTVNELHRLAYDLQTDTNSFLVLSEIYYPAGWKAYLDGKEIPIYATNYILRGMVIPAGTHKLELNFAPESYQKGIQYSGIGLLVTLLALAGGFFLQRRKPKDIQ